MEKYTAPNRKDVIIFAVFGVLMAAALICLLVLIISGRISDFENTSIIQIPLGDGRVFDVSGMSVVLICAFFLLMGRIVTDAKWKSTVRAYRSYRATMAILEASGELDRAREEFSEAISTGGPPVITDSYIFGEHTGCALRKEDIRDYEVSGKMRRSGAPITGEGVRVRLSDGNWYELCGAKAGKAAMSRAAEELERITGERRDTADPTGGQ
ncbi:MAG: hypothetical protein J5822_08470 [Eubacteriaceae bacterium]|nr:hypothetical protein [Eubacteriaceae bacterium]